MDLIGVINAAEEAHEQIVAAPDWLVGGGILLGLLLALFIVTRINIDR